MQDHTRFFVFFKLVLSITIKERKNYDRRTA
nr:MAG TPA: hypothetical protein [Caudoviricetes sp.]